MMIMFLINEEISINVTSITTKSISFAACQISGKIEKIIFDWKDKKFKITSLFLKIWKFQLKYANVLRALVWYYSAEINSNI